MATDTLLTSLLETGMLQFGRFSDGNEFAPIQLSLQFLPSYPYVLKQLGEIATKFIGDEAVDHLITTLDSVPFGLSTSLRNDIPLVYHSGNGLSAVHDLVGAYDIGHPALLIGNMLTGEMPDLIETARRVGLEVQSAIVIFNCGKTKAVDLGIPVNSILYLPQVIEELAKKGRLPQGQAASVEQWIAGTYS